MAIELRSNPLFLVCRQKLGFLAAAWQQKVGQYAIDYGRRSLQNQVATAN
jgi:hypothetical protein